jgi:hypothetical protein
MAAYTAAGTTLSISAGLPTAESATGYGALTYTVVGEITDIPEYGKVYTLVTHNPIGDRKTRKFKGSYNNGSLSLALARDPVDAGQSLALTALDDDENYSFEIEFSDGSIHYFQAKVMSYTTGTGTVDSIVTTTITLEIDTDILEVPPGT